MADKRGNRAGSEMPAEEPRGPDEARSLGDSHLRIVSPDAIFPEADFEPDDESPTIISKLPGHGDVASDRNSNDLRGRKLAHFELIEPIGVGGMAAVLRARDSQLDRFVALKILPPETGRDPENIRRFHQEARAAAKLDHENIARVFFCGEDQGLHFIAFEFVEGDNLRKILERRGRLPWREAIRYVQQVAVGLEHAASRGVVHRDIKPSNIIIGPDGRAKVVDMGLARSLEPHADMGLTQSGVTLGTFDYISPEQALEPRDADCRSDIYSLGCTLYHMLTGQPPVPEGTAAKKLQHHQHVAPVDPRQINPDVPDEIARILGKMMAKDIRDRYQRPIQVVQDISRFLKSTGDESGREQVFVDVQVSHAPPRRPILLVSSAVLLLAGLLFVLSLAPQSSNKGAPPKGAQQQPRLNPVAKLPTPEQPKPAPVTIAQAPIRTEEDLQAAIDRAADSEKAVITLANDIALTGKLKIAGSARSHPQIEIVGTERTPARLWLKLDKAPTAAIAGLRVENAKVSFKNIRFEIVASESAKQFDVPVAAVAVGSNGGVDCERCVFTQTGLPADLLFIERRNFGVIPAASLLVAADPKVSGDSPKATLRECYFPQGQAAVSIIGAASVSATDCAFHSLGTLFYLKGGGEPIVTLEHCSAYLRNGPAFRIDGETACRLKVEYSIFDYPASGATPSFLRQVDSTNTVKIIYQGQSNGYRNLNLWVAGSNMPIYDEPMLFQKFGAAGSSDNESHFLKYEPFQLETASSDDLAAAFQLNPAIPELQMPREKYSKHPMLGIRNCLGVTMPRLPPLPAEQPAVAGEYRPKANERVVDPDYVGSAPGYYTSLGQALVEPQPGDVILLKPTATHPEFTLRPHDLDIDLTIRGFPDTFPTLTLGKANIADPSLFRLLDGKLQLENLNLVVEPSRDGYASQSVVTIVGSGACTIRNCVITMKARDKSKSTPLSVVSLLASEELKMMMTNEARPSMPPPSVTLQDCFVRGDGDVVSLRGSRPVNVAMNKSLLYLGGSLLRQVQAASKEISNPDAAITLRMRESAVYFTDPMIWLQAGRAIPRYQHPVHVDGVDRCIFVTLADRALVALETPEMTEKTVMQHFDWKGQGNAFVNFDKAYMLEYTPADDAVRSFHIDENAWREAFEREGAGLYVPSGFKNLPTRPLYAATPEEVLRPESTMELQPYFSQLPRFHMPKN